MVQHGLQNSLQSISVSFRAHHYVWLWLFSVPYSAFLDLGFYLPWFRDIQFRRAFYSSLHSALALNSLNKFVWLSKLVLSLSPLLPKPFMNIPFIPWQDPAPLLVKT